MKVREAMAVCGVTIAAVCGAALGDSVTLNPTKDNSMYSESSGTANGAGVYMFCGKTAGDAIRRGLMVFDLGSIPAGSTITSASLVMYVNQARGGAAPCSLSRLTASWGEGTSDAGDPGGTGTAATIGDATWAFRFFNTDAWTTAGGDFLAASATTPVVGVGSYVWSSSGLAADVQQWLNEPATNFGWILRGDEATTQSAKRFYTHEYSDRSKRPTLVVEYTVPAPASAGLAAAGLVFAGRRRRRG